VRLSHLGDVVHALPVFHALRRSHPEAEIGWVVQPEFAGLIEGLPGLSRILRFDRRGGLGAWNRLRCELEAFGADWAVDAQGNWKSGLATRISGAGRRSGLHPSDWREPHAARVLTDFAPSTGREVIHAMERMIALAEYVAPSRGDSAVRTDPGLSPTECARGKAAFASAFPGEGPRAVLLHLSSRADVRSWPLQHFERLARRVSSAGARVLVVSGPAEAEEGRVLAERLESHGGVRHWIGQKGLRELAAFFTAAGEAGATMVCCDSGPMHLAAACGLELVCLSGPQDERRTGPWRRDAPHRSLRAPCGPPCAPCRARRCDHPQGTVCMARLDPDIVAGLLH